METREREESWELVEAGGKRTKVTSQLLRLFRILKREEGGNWSWFSDGTGKGNQRAVGGFETQQ